MTQNTVEAIVAPQLQGPSEARVFLVDDSEAKRDAVIESLETFGLAGSLVVAKTMEEAEAYIDVQVPGSLDSNVFLLDGNIDERYPSDLRHGDLLAGRLVGKYSAPLTEITDTALEALKAQGLSNSEIEKILGHPSWKIHEVCVARLHTEALVVGISRDSHGSIHDAQIPITSYQEVGKTVFETIISRKVRRRLESAQQHEENLRRRESLASQKDV